MNRNSPQGGRDLPHSRGLSHSRGLPRDRSYLLRPLGHLILLGGSFFTIFPFIWMLSTSLKGPVEVLSINPRIIPQAARWQNYVEVFSFLPTFGRIYLNTVFRTVVVVAGQLFFSAMAAFAFARLRFPGKGAMFVAVLAILMIPSQTTLIPNYILLSRLGWVNTFQGLIIPSMFSAMGIFLLRQYFLGLPAALIDAARIDGCSPFWIFARIGLPLAKSAVLAFGIMSALWAWNDFLWPLILCTSEDMYLLSVGIGLFEGQFQTNFALMMAAATMAAVPMLIIFIILQRPILEGIALSGLK